MNIKNALGFLVLGLLMQVMSVFSQSANHLEFVDNSVRIIWMEFMSWVIGGIGSTFLVKESAVRLPALLVLLTPEQFLHSGETLPESVRLEVGARASVSN